MRLKLILLLLFLYPTLIFAQYDYYKTYNGSNYNITFNVVEELETYNEQTVISGNFLTVINKQGQVNWAKRITTDSADLFVPSFGLNYTSLAATPDGGFIGIANKFPYGIVSRYDSLGNEQWSKSIYSPNEVLSLDDILRTSNDEYIISIRPFISTTNSYLQWMKIDVNGNTQWIKSYVLPGGGHELTVIKENNLGYIMSGLFGTVVQIDFNGNIIWVRQHNMRVQDIFTFNNNDYIIIGFNTAYTNHTWQRTTNTGTVLWTKGIATPFSSSSIFHFSKNYNMLSDSNIIDIRPFPSAGNPQISDAVLTKLNTQTGNVIRRKRYLSNMPVGANPYINDFVVVTDTIFKLFPRNVLQTNNYYYGNYMRINTGYNLDSLNCVLQDEPTLATFNETVSVATWQPLMQTLPLVVQPINLYQIDIPLFDIVVCENGIAANFDISDHLLCKDDCITITDTSSGNITSWEWTFFGADTTFHYDRFPPQLCYPNAGTFSIQLVVSNSFLSDTIRRTIKVFHIPEIDLGQDTVLCQGQFIVPIFQIPNAEYLWSNGNTTPFLFINADGLYSVEVSAGAGACYETDSIEVSVVVLPDVNLGADTAFCNVNNFLLDATIPNGTYTYEWQDNSTNPQFTVTTSGLYSVSVTDTLGCENTDDILLDFNNIPGINLGVDTAICQGETITLNAAIANATYLWSDSSTDSTLTVSTSGSYSVEVTRNGCYTRDTIFVTVEALPIVNLGNDSTFCNANGYNLTANTSNSVNYLWNTNATTASIFINTSGIYALMVTDTLTTCQATDSVEINLIQSAAIDLGNDTTLCQGENLYLDVFTPNATYLWNNNSTDSILIVNTSGQYSVDVTLNNCVESDTIMVLFNTLPTVNLGDDLTFCNVSDYNLTANTSNNVNYLWNTNATTESIFINTSGIYALIVTDTFTTCQATDSVEMTFIQTNSFDLGNDTILCDNQLFLLNAFVPDATYLWNTGLTSSELLVENNGLYSVAVSIGNCSTTDSINIVFITPNQLDFGENTVLCNDEIIELNVFNANATSYLWQDNSTLPTMQVNQAGTYFAQVIYNDNCQISDTITFTPEAEIAPTLPTDTIICKDNQVTLNAYQPNAISYEWETVEAYYNQHDLRDSVIIATLPGLYQVTVSNECRAFTQYINIEEEDCGCYPYIPNAFSPNNDGVNDVFEVYTNCLLQDFNLKIFDRWGGIIYEADDINTGWDGSNTNEKLNNGVYVWVLTYTAPNDRGEMTTVTKSGSLTLMR